MESHKKISKKELFAKYKPIRKIPLKRWQFRSSIKRIIKREMSATGKISYCVQFLNNETASIPACQLQKICHKLVEDFELDRFKQSTVNNDRRRSKRLTKRSDSSSDETSSSESDDSDDDQQLSSFTTTRSGRIQTMPKSYQQEFHTKLNTKKDRKEKYRSVPFYSDDFIKRHSIHCFRCYKTGYPNGSRNDTFEVSCGPTRQRTRLLLCQTCSLSCHNNCLPALNDHCFDTQTSHYTCVKCKNKTFDCVGCQKNIDKTNDKVLFRCKSCFRPYHPHCINNDLYEEGDCHDCATFKDRQPQSILAQRKDSENREELLIKWKDESFRHVNWVSASWIQALYTTLYTYYKKKRDDEDSEPKKGRYFPIEWTMIERILNVEWKDKNKQQVKRVFAVFKDTDYGDAIWDEPPAEDEPELLAAYKLALERYIRATKVKPPQKMKQLIADIRRLANAEKYESHELKAQPRYIEGGVLMQHQLEALNWLLFQWEKQQPCILADDMGLGKTIQVISFLYVLFRKYSIYPFIIVVPNSTATNWIREFQKWAPDMSVVPFFGLGASRKLALDNEIFDKHMNLKCHAVVATYESIQESTKLQNIFWPVMIVDESQRLKNDESQLFKALNRFNKDQSILLTGTPLQNNLKELFNIMNFIRPTDFHGTQAEDYEDMTREQVEELHSRLRPYFLRRTKEEILKTLPPKHEIIVPLSMTPLQKEVYKSCLSRDIESILGTTTYKRSKGLTSIFMNLRKTLNHPYLIDGVETHQPTAEATQRAMIDACEKLKFFHQMLPKLRSQGHRVLIFSTMTRALDVLDDYLTYEDIGFARLDGSDSERERVRNIDAFNAPNSKLDVFLLSTRAGGVGINLATADTVIIWDSDFNPYADLQAIGRAHRIGQTKMVLIYRFMTRLSVEERILQIGRKKMALEHVVVEKMSSEEDTIEDIESILRFGAQALFDNDDSADISYDSAAIDRLLDRDQYKAVAEAQKEKDIAEAQDQKGGLSFAYAKVWKTDGTSEELTETAADEAAQADFWEKFLQSKQEEVERKKAEKKLHDMNLGRGARKRAQVSYSEKLYGDADSGRQKKSKSKEIRKDEDDEYAFIESEDEELNENTGEEGTSTEGGSNDIIVEGALNVPEQLSTLKFKKSTVQRSKKGTNQRSQNSSTTKRMRMTEPMPLPPTQTNNPNETLIPKVSAAFLEQMNLALRTIFERHCRLVQDYLIVCGKERVPKDFYEANIKRGIAHLVKNLRIEVETAINREQQHLQSTGTPLDALSAYTRTKYEIFEKSIEGALTQFELWKNYNEPLLISMGTREYMLMEKKYVQTQSNQNQQLPSSGMHNIDQSSVPHDSHNIAQSHASPQPQPMQSRLSNSPAMNQPLGQSGLQSHSPSQRQPIQYNSPPSISQSIAAPGSSPQSQPIQLQFSNQPKTNQSPGPSGSQPQHPSQLPQPVQLQYNSPSTINQSLGPSSSQSQHIQLIHPIYSNLPGINQSPGPSGSQHIQLHFNGQPIMSQPSSQPLRFNSPSSTDQSSGDFQSKSVPSQFSAPSSVHQHSGLSQSQSVQLQSDKQPSTSQSSGSSEPQPMQLKFSSTPEGKTSPIPSGSQPMYNTFQAIKLRAPPPQSQTIQAYFAKTPNVNLPPRPSESQPSQDTHSPTQPHSQSQSQPVQSQYSIHPQSYK